MMCTTASLIVGRYVFSGGPNLNLTVSTASVKAVGYVCVGVTNRVRVRVRVRVRIRTRLRVGIGSGLWSGLGSGLGLVFRSVLGLGLGLELGSTTAAVCMAGHVHAVRG